MLETTISYGLRERMQLSLRLPYDVKDMRIRYETLDGAPFTPPYGDIHHRTQTLRGISDPTVGVDWMPRTGSQWMFGAGLSLPSATPSPIPSSSAARDSSTSTSSSAAARSARSLSAQWWRRGERVDLVRTRRSAPQPLRKRRRLPRPEQLSLVVRPEHPRRAA